MKGNIQEREYDKFRDATNEKSKVAVIIEQDVPVPIDSSGVNWDEIITTFPSNIQELYTYKKNTSIVQTVLVQYENSNKKNIVYINKMRA
jgi:hypothetical protein